MSICLALPALSCGTAEGEQSTNFGGESGGEGVCGNAFLEDDEECDNGSNNGDDLECTSQCTINVCGDGLTLAGEEECDDGDDNADGAECTSACTINVCGDGFVLDGKEACDDGNDDESDECRNDCTLTSCGDGVEDAGEECDDGNEDDTDACVNCFDARCGDGFVQEGKEECDDGNMDSDDACISGTCQNAMCGDGFVWEGMETCDDANMENTDACPSTCQTATCGDGYIHEGVEECDDSNMDAEDGCDSECQAEFCWQLINTPAEDLTGNTWFDACVDEEGTTVVVRLLDKDNQKVYEQSGDIVGDWTYDNVTSTAGDNQQYLENAHNRIITLGNGDKLFISGKGANSMSPSCQTGMGDGYGVMVYPSNANWYFNPKIVAMPYKGGQTSQARDFTSWGEDYEISYNDGDSFNLCTGDNEPFEGTFMIEIE